MTNIINPYRYASGYSLLIEDTFSDSDGTDITSRSPDTNTPGNSWVNVQRTWTCESGRAEANGTYGKALIDSGVSDGIVQCDIQLVAATTSRGAIYFRAAAATGTGSQSTWYLQAQWQTSNTGTLYLQRIISGSDVTIDSTSIGEILPGTFYTLKVEFTGSDIVGTFNDNETVSASDSTHSTNTIHGMLGWSPTVVEGHDNFRVYG